LEDLVNEGRLVAICLTPRSGGPMVRLDTVEAVAGRGLRGDRYFHPEGDPKAPTPGEEATLIELEAVEHLQYVLQRPLDPSLPRRNLVTQGVSLNDLVGRVFVVGEVWLEGVEPCDPCSHLESLTYPGVLRALVGRGGLRARIVRGGTLRVGDPITPSVPPGAAP
jgi:MOSC domain-containing protein YiiM